MVFKIGFRVPVEKTENKENNEKEENNGKLKIMLKTNKEEV